MTESDFQLFAGCIVELFPDKFSPAAAVEWRKWVMKLTPYEADAALSEYYASPKTASDGPTPSLAGFRRCLRAKKDGQAKVAPGPLADSFGDYVRSIARQFIGEAANDISDPQARMIWACWEYRTHAARQPYSGHTIAYWLKWQNLAQDAGFPAYPLAVDGNRKVGWSEQADAHYRGVMGNDLVAEPHKSDWLILEQLIRGHAMREAG